MQLEQYVFDVFMSKYRKGEFAFQRLGQAFFNHFNLHKMRPTPFTDKIWNMDGNEALAYIKQNVEFA